MYQIVMLPLVFHCLDSNIFRFGYFISMQTIQKSNPIYQFEYRKQRISISILTCNYRVENIFQHNEMVFWAQWAYLIGCRCIDFRVRICAFHVKKVLINWKNHFRNTKFLSKFDAIIGI